MKPVFEIATFLTVAVVAHVGAFALLSQGGVSAGGDGGGGQITLEGGDPGMAAMVAAWNRPPDLAAPVEPPAGAHPDTDDETLPEPPLSAPPSLPSLQAMAPLAEPADTRPDSTPPAPPVAMMPAPEPAPDLPHTTDTATVLPPSSPQATSTLAGLFDPSELVNESPDTALPDTAPPPPLPRAQAPERSPHPPARPAPRQSPQANPPQPSAEGTTAAQRASGTGAQGHEGQAGQARQTSRAQVDTGGLVAQWGGAIRAAVLRQQRHPAGRRTEGTVLLRLEVHSDGHLRGVALQQSSGHAALDRAALDAVRRARIPAAPQGLNGSFQFNLPVRFSG